MKNLFKTIMVLLVLTVVLSAALEIKDFVNKEPEPQREVITVPKTDSTHRNLACRIQRIQRFNKIG